MGLTYFSTLNPADCCGCKGCEQVCSHKAIFFEVNNEGFEYPHLDTELCVNCGLCVNVCPMTNAASVKQPIGQAIVVQNNNSSDLMSSSSGGAFVAIAKYVLNRGGVVYGAAYANGTIVEHRRVVSETGLIDLVGSKYIQSDIKNSFSNVKNDLKNKKLVYFTGTPCQVSGLRLYLRKDYDNLITSDLVCHGVPSPKIFQKVVQSISEQVGGSIIDYSFRDKRIHGWSCCSSSSWKIGNKKKYVKYSKDMEAYFNAFISGDLMRMSCYECPYACRQRTGDITIADFWGVRRMYPDFPNISKGVSLILVNSEKGKYIINNIIQNFYSMKITIEEGAKYNHNLNHPTSITQRRFESYILAFGNYRKFVERYYQGNVFINRIKVEFEYFLRKHSTLFTIVSKLSKIKNKRK